jgi:hypothetical protein
MAPSSISKLSLMELGLMDEAMPSFVQFMKMRREHDSGVAPLDELVIEWVWGEELCGFTFASMFCKQQDDSNGEWHSTLGSALHSLSLSNVHNECEGFLPAMAENSHLLELKVLKLSELDDSDCQDLAAFLRQPSSVQELELNKIADCSLIVAGLQCSGALRRVSIPGDKESRVANAYCLCNALLGALLQTFAVAESLDDDVTNDRSKEERGSKHLYPALLQIAKQIATTRSTTALSSLLNLRESLGPIQL